MGQNYSQPKFQPRSSLASFDPVKYQGDWWFIGKTNNEPWDQNSKEYKQVLTWNAKENKTEAEDWGYNENKVVPYTLRYGQFWSTNKPAGWMTVHFNGWSKYINSCIMWTDYDNYAIFYSPVMGGCYLKSRKRKINPKDGPMLNKILCQIGINPNTMKINNVSIDNSAPPTVWSAPEKLAWL